MTELLRKIKKLFFGRWMLFVPFCVKILHFLLVLLGNHCCTFLLTSSVPTDNDLNRKFKIWVHHSCCY